MLMKTVRLSQVLCAVVGAILFGTSVTLAGPSVLIIGHSYDGVGDPNHLTFWKLPQLLHNTYGFDVGSCTMADVTPAKLAQFNAVIVCGLGSVVPDGQNPNQIDDFSISQSKFNALTNQLLTYVNGGGGLYIYGRSFISEGGKSCTDTLSSFVFGMGASIPFAQLHDSGREAQQTNGAHYVYALANSISNTTATAGVTNWWYPVVGNTREWTFALSLLDTNWTPLIQTSANATNQWLNADNTNNGDPVVGLQTIYATRSYGSGRIVLNGSESTISLFGYDYSDYANSIYGFIGMSAGLDGSPSDGLALLVSSLSWLTTDNAANHYGGFIPPTNPPAPRYPAPYPWSAPVSIAPVTYYKGIFAVEPALGGGSGTVAGFKSAAQNAGCSYIVVAGDFTQMLANNGGSYLQASNAWSTLVQDCAAVTDPNFVAFPALITRDLQTNSFLIYQRADASVWPLTNRLDTTGRYVVDHESYVWTDCKGAMRTVFRLSAGQYPVWMAVNYDTLAVRTYDNTNLVEDLLTGQPASQQNALLQAQEQGDRCRVVTMTLLTDPAQVTNVTDFTYLQANSMDALQSSFTDNQYIGGNVSYVSDGPQVQNWYLENPVRDTYGGFYVPGTERCRVRLKVSSTVGLSQITLYDHLTPIRVFTVSGTSYELSVELLHDMRHALTAVIEDVNGKRAITGALEAIDMLFWQYYCGDRLNSGGGWMDLRDNTGLEEIDLATCTLYKDGSLQFNAPYDTEVLPGVDGSERQPAFVLLPTFQMAATDSAKSELNFPGHKITRAYENADVIITETPVLKRGANGAGITPAAPFVNLKDPLVDAKLTQYHFYRKNTTNTLNSVFPAAMMADLSMTITATGSVTLATTLGGELSQQFGSSVCPIPNITTFSYVHAGGGVDTYNVPDTSMHREQLSPGDLLLLPEVGEGLFVLQGTPTFASYLWTTNGGFYCVFGRGDTATLTNGAQTFYRLCHVIMDDTPRPATAQAEFLAFRDAYGIKDGVPTGYTVSPVQGSVTGQQFLLDLAATNFAWRGTISPTGVPLAQRLPVRVTGLNPKWTSVKLVMSNNPNNEWFPLGVTSNGESYTTVDVSQGPLDLFIGQPVTTTNADVSIALIRDPDIGVTRADVHNPLGSAATVTLTAPVSTFLAGVQTQTVSVAANSSLSTPLATTVTITSPTNGALYGATQPIPLVASVTYVGQTFGTVTQVVFYANGGLIGTSPTSPFQTNWTAGVNGSYTLTALAYGTSGACATSSAVNITVSPRSLVQSGYWDNPAVWSPSGVPMSGDDVYVGYNSGNNLTVTVTNSGTMTCGKLTIATGGLGTMVQTNGLMSVTTPGIGQCVIGANGGNGRYRLDGGTLSATNIIVGCVGNGVLEINGGTVLAGTETNAGTYIGMIVGYYSGVGVVTQRAGTVTCPGQLCLGYAHNVYGATGQYVMMGGHLTFATDGGYFQNQGAGSVFQIIGTNGVIQGGSMYMSDNAALRYTLSSGGVSPLNSWFVYLVAGQSVLTLDVLGQVALWTTNSFTLIDQVTYGFVNDFAVTNRSVFTTTKGGTNYTATLDNGCRMAATPLVYPGSASFTATNQGWVAISTNGLSQSSFDLWLTLQTNGTTHTMAQIVAQVSNSGLMVSDGSTGGVPYLHVTLTKPAVATAYLGWDFVNFDPAVRVQAVQFNDAPNDTLTSPMNGAAYLRPAVGGIVLTDVIANTMGTITNVNFYTNGTLVVTGKLASASTYTNGWANPPPGRYGVNARGWDSYGAVGNSLTNTVLVWTNQDIGAVSKTGSATYTNPTYTVIGAGAGITSTADAFRFVYLPLTGNCTVVAQVTSFTGTVVNARAGVMMRVSTNANAIEVSSLYAASDRKAYLQRRTTAGGSTTLTGSSATYTPTNCWVRLVRSNTTFTASVSSNNVTWTQIGVTNLTLTDPIQVGLAVTSGTTASTNTGKFTNVSITLP